MEVLVIKKHSKSDTLTPQQVSIDPDTTLPQLLKFFVEVTDKIPCPTERGLWGTNDFGWLKGKYSFITVCIFPEDSKKDFSFITLKREPGLFDDEETGAFSLTQLHQLGDYSQIEFPPKYIPRLLQNTAIFGELTESNSPLRPLYLGKHILQLLPNYKI